MNLKKAIKILRDRKGDRSWAEHVNYLHLEHVIKALAESDEGEETFFGKDDLVEKDGRVALVRSTSHNGTRLWVLLKQGDEYATIDSTCWTDDGVKLLGRNWGKKPFNEVLDKLTEQKGENRES